MCSKSNLSSRATGRRIFSSKSTTKTQGHTGRPCIQRNIQSYKSFSRKDVKSQHEGLKRCPAVKRTCYSGRRVQFQASTCSSSKLPLILASKHLMSSSILGGYQHIYMYRGVCVCAHARMCKTHKQTNLKRQEAT